MELSTDLLTKLMPFGEKRIPPYVVPLNLAMAKFNIVDPLEVAMFLAQLAHESGQFRYTEELASGKAYEGRADLGNTSPGDGMRFKGRGLIQITGRANYALASFDLYGDPRLIDDPSILAQTSPACLSAAWFWHHNKLSRFATDIRACTKHINGGYNGLAERTSYWVTAKRLLGVEG